MLKSTKMFIKDEIICVDGETHEIKVLAANPLSRRMLLLTFTNNSVDYAFKTMCAESLPYEQEK